MATEQLAWAYRFGQCSEMYALPIHTLHQPDFGPSFGAFKALPGNYRRSYFQEMTEFGRQLSVTQSDEAFISSELGQRG